MAIILVPQPGSAPSSLAEWVNSVESLKQYNLGVNDPVDYNFDGDTIKKGVLITIGGSNYYCNADTAITGTASDYVKITSAGVASYVTDLTGVSWNDTYNFYADVTGNAYIFNEAKAVYDGVVTDPKTKRGMASLLGYFKEIVVGVVNGALSITGALSAASATITGLLYAGSASIAGALSAASVTTDNVAIKHKEFTGTLTVAGTISVSHGLNEDKIISVSASLQSTSGVWYSQSFGEFGVAFSSGSLILTASSYASQPYRALITYKA